MTESEVLTPYSELILAMMIVARLTETRLRKMRSQETGSNILHSTGLGLVSSLQETGRKPQQVGGWGEFLRRLRKEGGEGEIKRNKKCNVDTLFLTPLPW